MSLKLQEPSNIEEITKYMTKAVKQPKNGFKNHDSWWSLQDLVCHFENDNGFDYKVRKEIWEGIGGFEMPKTYANILKLLQAIVEANGKRYINLLHL